jgi:hypothetical protein
MSKLVSLNRSPIALDTATQTRIAAFLNDQDDFAREVSSLIEANNEIHRLAQERVRWPPERICEQGDKALDRLDSALAKLTQIDVTETRVKPIRDRLGAALDKAHASTITQCVTFMLDAKPASSSPNPAGLAKAMAAEVIAWAPSLVALLCACRVLWRSEDRFTPSIGEVLRELERQERAWRDKFETICQLPDKAEVIARLSENRAHIAEVLERHGERQHELQEGF